MPSATQVSSVSRTNSVVTIAADGIPRRSKAMASRMQHEQHDPLGGCAAKQLIRVPFRIVENAKS
jgi:hypothetical protein